MPPITAPRITPRIPVTAAMIVGSIDWLFLLVRQHGLQISVISLRFSATDEAHFFRLTRRGDADARSEEHTSELQSRQYLVCRLLLEKKKPLVAEIRYRR